MGESLSGGPAFDPTSVDLIERYGFQVLPELRPEELGIAEPEPLPTDEGDFMVYGVNATDAILRLRSIWGNSLADIAKEMPELQEPLNEYLARLNERVLGMGLTHQNLASFLVYAEAACAHLETRAIQGPTAFEYNGRTFVRQRRLTWRGGKRSPFKDGDTATHDDTLTCLEDGKVIHYSELLPRTIGKYGFYGDGSYFLDPVQLAEMAGLTDVDRTNDPVEALVQDVDSLVWVTNSDQLSRLDNLRRVGLDVFGPNCTILPENLGTLLNVLTLSLAAPPEQTRLLDRLGTPAAVIPEVQQLLGHRAVLLLRDIPRHLPQLQPVVLQMIESLELRRSNEPMYDTLTEEFIQELINAGMAELSSGEVDGYATTLARRLNLEDEETISLLHSAAAKLYQEQRTAAKKQDLTKAIQQIMPAFRYSAIAYLRTGAKRVAANATLAKVLDQR